LYLLTYIVSLTTKLKQNNDLNTLITQPNIDISIVLENFEIDFLKKQFDAVFIILNHVSNYQRFQAIYYETRKFKFYRPKFEISETNFEENMVDKNNNNNNNNNNNINNIKEKRRNNMLAWWKYSIQTVIKKMRYAKGQ